MRKSKRKRWNTMMKRGRKNKKKIFSLAPNAESMMTRRSAGTTEGGPFLSPIPLMRTEGAVNQDTTSPALSPT